MAKLLPFFFIAVALLSNADAQNILEAFSSLIGTTRIKNGAGSDIFGQFFNNPSPLNALLGGKGGGGLNFDSILRTFQPPAGGGSSGSLPDIATLLKNGITDIISMAGVNNTRTNGSSIVSRPRPTLNSAESESEGIPIHGGFDSTRRSEEQKLTGFSNDSISDQAENDPAYLLLNDRQPPPPSNRNSDDLTLEQILRAIKDSNF